MLAQNGVGPGKQEDRAIAEVMVRNKERRDGDCGLTCTKLGTFTVSRLTQPDVTHTLRGT